MALSTPQKDLITSFFSVALLYCIVLMTLHYTLCLIHLAPDSLLLYTPFILIGSILIYYRPFLAKVRAVQFRGAGNITVSTVYFMTLLAAPFAFLNGIALYTDRIVAIKSVDQLKNTTETFIHIAHLEPAIEQLVDTITFETSTDEDGQVSTRFDYLALVPFTSTTSHAETWMVVTASEITDDFESIAWLLQRQELIRQTHREKVKRFPYDSIQYVEKVDLERPLDLLNAKHITTRDPKFVFASLNSAANMRITWIWIMGGTSLVLSLFFFKTVATGHYEEIEND